MAQDLNLSLKIKTLVEGLKQVEALANEVRVLGSEARKPIPDNAAKFRAGVDSARVATRGLVAEIGAIKGDNIRAAVQQFGELKRHVAGQEAALKSAREEATRLAGQLKASGGADPKLARSFDEARAKAAALKTEVTAGRQSLELMRRALGDAGINTGRLSESMRTVAKEAAAAQTQTQKLAAAAQTQGDRLAALARQSQRVTQARSVLGIDRDTTERDIRAVQAALQRLKDSGTASMQEIARASIAAKARITELRAAAQAAAGGGEQAQRLAALARQSQRVTQARSVLGIDRDTTERDIRAVQAALQRLKDSGTASMQEIARASRAAKERIAELRGETKKTAGVFNDMRDEIARLLTLGAITKFVTDSVRAVRTAEASFKGLEAVANFTGVGIERAFAKATALSADGLLTVADASKSLQNLLSRGYDIDQAEQTINRLKDAAAFNRAAHLSMSEAVLTATEGLKNENSILVDNAGITKNVSVLWKEYADSIGKSATELSTQEKVQAEVNGIMRETQAQLGNAAKASSGLEGGLAKLHKSAVDLKTAFGSSLVPTLTRLAEVGASLLNDWVRPFLGGIEIMGIKLGALVKSASDIMSGNFSAIEKNFELADEMALEVVARYEQGVIPAALNAKDAVDQEALARRKAQKEEEARRLASEENAKRMAKLRGDEIALTRATIDAQAKLIADGIEREQQLLDQQKEDNLISLRDYYAQRSALQVQAANAEIARVTDEIAAQRQVLRELEQSSAGSKPEDQEQERLQALAKVKTLTAELTVLELKRGDIAGGAARAQAQAEQELAAQLDRVQIALLQAQGRDADARTLETSQQYGELIKRLQVEGDAAGEALVRKLINVEAARAQLDQLRAEYSRALAAMQLEEQRIGHDRDAGLKSEMQARREIVDLHKRTSQELSVLVPQMEALGESIGSDAAADVARIGEEVRSLGLVVDETAAQMNSALQSGLSTFFDDIMSGTQKGKNAFEAFGDSVVATLRRIIAEKAAMQLIDATVGSSFGQAIAGIFHTGGIVGGAAPTRTISPLAFVGAPRYHSGGVLGLKPDEVPAILQRGEEVLTRNDPRHRNNGGTGGNVTVQMTITTPDADSFRRSQGRIARDMADAARRAQERHG